MIDSAPPNAERPPDPPRRRIRTKIIVAPQDDGEGNWLVSYADMMTLLFGFFVILSAFSTPDASKVEKLKQETAKSMGVKYENPYESISAVLEDVLKASNLEQDVNILKTDEGITIVSRGTLFFDSGSTELKERASLLMNSISTILVQRAAGFRVVVEGHTDNVPIISAKYPSNWELSSSRASSVVRLLEGKGFPHSNLRPVGMADTEPVAPNTSADGTPLRENQAQNRRIVIRVLKQLPARLEKETSADAKPTRSASPHG